MSAEETLDRSELTGPELKETRTRAFRLLGRAVRPHLKLVLAGSLLTVLASLLEAIMPLFLALGLDRALPAFRDGDSRPLWFIGGAFLLCCLVVAFAFWSSMVLTAKASQAALIDVRTGVFRKVQRLPIAFHEKYTSGRSIARQTSDMDAVQEFLDGGLHQILSTLLFLVFTVGLIISLDPMSLLVLAVMAVPMTLVMRWYWKNSEIAFRETRTHSARLIGKFVETFTGIRAVQSFRKEKRNDAAYAEIAANYQKATMDSIGLFGVLQPSIIALGNLSMVGVLALGGWRALHGEISVGTVAAVALATKQLFGPLQGFLMVLSSMQSAQSALEKISGLLEEPEPMQEPEHPAQLGPAEGELDFQDVSFGYTPAKLNMEHLDLRIPAGQTVAVVGATGAGKTTLAKLASRFYDVTSGRLLLDGTDIKNISDADLRRRVVMVTQEAYLFGGTVAENIALGKPDATREEIVEAATAVGAHEFIEALPDGYDTDVNKRGGRVSAGQRQLISFARAFIADPAVLILDEATSSLDLPSERAVQKALETLLGERTAIIIAHRLSTVAIADRVLVVSQGQIIEDGSPAELVAAGGEYARLDAAWQRSVA